MSERVKTYFGEILNKDKNIKIITIIGIAIIAVIFIYSMLPEQVDDESQTIQEITTDEYIAQMEGKVEELLSSISGVGIVKVMLTLENSEETVFQSETKNKTSTSTNSDGKSDTDIDYEENIVIVEGDNGKKQALIKTSIPPKIKGIAIVCEGGDNASVVNQITNMIKAVFDLSSTKINVAKLTNQE